MSLSNLPTETIDKIAFFCHSREDLLSLGLSCRSYYSIVARSHLHYRDIRCPLFMPALWKRLARPDDPHAPLVQSLTIVPQGLDWNLPSELRDGLPLEERVPEQYSLENSGEDWRHYIPDVDELREGEGVLISALRRMENLHRFRWYCCPGPQSQGENNLWSTVNSLGTVEHLDILDLPHYKGYKTSFVIQSESLASFRGLRSLHLRTHDYDLDDPRPLQLVNEPVALNITPLLQMVALGCPNMEKLCLHLDIRKNFWEDDSADVLLRIARWPRLRCLQLKGLTCNMTDIAHFLSCHPTIEELTLLPVTRGIELQQNDASLADDILPSLRTLECHISTAAALLKNPRVITTLQTFHAIDDYSNWYDDQWDGEIEDSDVDPDIFSWKAQVFQSIRDRPSITSVSLGRRTTCSELIGLGQVAPQLKRLSLDGLLLDDEDECTDGEGLHAFVFPCLEYLVWTDIPGLDKPESYQPLIKRTICTLVKTCPHLKEVGDPWRKVVILDKAAGNDGIKWVIRDRKDSSEPVFLESDAYIE